MITEVILVVMACMAGLRLWWAERALAKRQAQVALLRETLHEAIGLLQKYSPEESDVGAFRSTAWEVLAETHDPSAKEDISARPYGGKAIWNEAAEASATVPEAEWEAEPRDASKRLDDYLYGNRGDHASADG